MNRDVKKKKKSRKIVFRWDIWYSKIIFFSRIVLIENKIL